MLRALLLLSVAAYAADPAALVRASSAAWRNAAIAQDRAALELWLATDLVYAHSSGKTESKAEYIAAVLKGPSHYRSFTESNTAIRVYGSAAILEGHVEVTPASGEPYRVRTLEVYVLEGGRWKMTAHQSARLRP